jgi:hypothetical protein
MSDDPFTPRDRMELAGPPHPRRPGREFVKVEVCKKISMKGCSGVPLLDDYVGDTWVIVRMGEGGTG